MVDIRRPEEGVAGDSTSFAQRHDAGAQSALAAASFITHTYRKGMACTAMCFTLRAAKFVLTNE